MNKNIQFILRKFKHDDYIDLHNALGDKRVVKHMASSGITLEDCKKIISEAAIHWQQYKIGSYAVIDKEASKIIGWAGFKWWKEGEFEIVIVLSPHYFGLGSKICDKLIDKARNEFHLSSIYILLPETRKSFIWIKRKGFEFCGNEMFHDEPFKKFVKYL